MTTITPDRISLPQEVLDLVIDQTWVSTLSQPDSNRVHVKETGDHQTLRSFLRVSRSFRHHVLPYIFKDVELTVADNSPTNHLGSLQDVLESPSLAGSTLDSPGRHIQSVMLSFVTFSNTRPRGHTFDTNSLLCQDSVISLLKSLHRHACSLATLSVQIDRGVLVSWVSLDIAFQEAFQALVRLKSLRLLKTVNLIRLPTTFLKGTHLNGLQVVQDNPWPYDVEDPSMAFSPPNPADEGLPDPPLEILVTDHTCPFGAVPIISSPGSLFSGLKRLGSIMISRTEVQRTWSILAASPKLESLLLDLQGEIESPPPTFDLGKLPYLQSIMFQHNRHQGLAYVATNDQSLAKIFNLLDAPSPMEHFEDLELNLILTEHDVRTDFFHPTNRSNVSQWEQFDMLLTGPKYPALKTVSLSFVVHVMLSRESNEFDNKVFLSTTIRKLRDELPRLSATDKISFNMKLESKVSQAMGMLLYPE